MMKKGIKGYLVYNSFKQFLKMLELLLTEVESKQKSVPKRLTCTWHVIALQESFQATLISQQLNVRPPRRQPERRCCGEKQQGLGKDITSKQVSPSPLDLPNVHVGAIICWTFSF